MPGYGPSAPALPPTLVVVASVVDALVLVGSASMVSTMTQEDIIHLRGMYEVPDHITITAFDRSDRVIFDPEGGIALYEGFFHAGLCLLLHLFILGLLDHYRLVPAQFILNALRIICSFTVLCYFYGIVARFFSIKEGWWFIDPRRGRKIRFQLPSFIKGWKN